MFSAPNRMSKPTGFAGNTLSHCARELELRTHPTQSEFRSSYGILKGSYQVWCNRKYWSTRVGQPSSDAGRMAVSVCKSA